MRNTLTLIFFPLSILMGSSALAQTTVRGQVFDDFTKEPLYGVSVYFDGTTIGTITDEEGYFEITTPRPITALLVVTFIGYKSQIFKDIKKKDLGKIFLKESAFQLDEVILEPDTWSREKKWNIFKREFLGQGASALGCKITNGEKVRLYYSRSKDALFAYTDEPIQVENSYLGYQIAYDVQDFEVFFEYDEKGNHVPKSVFFLGTLLFSELDGSLARKRYVRNREKAYFGSVLHFMRALSERRLLENDFKVYRNSRQVDPYLEFRLRNTNGFVMVKPVSDSLTIRYKIDRSMMKVNGDAFLIDGYGNFSPSKSVQFGGVLGRQRVALMLPLDYIEPMPSN
ncbi:MAG: carboxypeptidase-like regulatory domain-containing protein [Bacteroidota bacterium]